MGVLLSAVHEPSPPKFPRLFNYSKRFLYLLAAATTKELTCCDEAKVPMYTLLNQPPARNRGNDRGAGSPGPFPNYSRPNGYSGDTSPYRGGGSPAGSRSNNPYAVKGPSMMGPPGSFSPYGNFAQPKRFNSGDRAESPMESITTMDTTKSSFSSASQAGGDLARSRRAVADQIIRDVYSKMVIVDGKRVPETSYQTHVLIQEYSHFPSEPPPPNTPASQVGTIKNRILVICVKHSGRLLLQKGKLNEQKNIYQIGRTWDLDELKAIARVGPDGILLSLNKDYYWKVSEGAERTVRFIKALLSYYGLLVGRYTQLKGISMAELNLPHQPRKIPYVGLSNVSSMTDLGTKDPSRESPLILPKPSNQKSASNVSVPPAQNQGDYYKEFDFTSNGQLPMKPMKVLERGSIKDDNDDDELNFNPEPDRTVYSELPTEDSFDFGTPDVMDDLNAQSDPVLARGSTSEVQNRDLSNTETSDKFHTPLHLRQNSKTTGLLSHSRGPSGNFSTPKTYSPRKQVDNNSLRTDDSKRGSKISLEEQIVEDFSRSIPDRSNPKTKTFSHDFGIEEITDESDADDDSSSVVRRSQETRLPLKGASNVDKSKRESMINTDPLDTSIQEIENLLDSQFSGKRNDPNVSVSQDVPRKKSLKQSGLEKSTGYALEEDESMFSKPSEGGLNIKLPGENEPSPYPIEVDPEVEEVLEEVSWNMTDTGDSLIKKLTKELHGVKGKNIEELLSLDFGNNIVANEFGTSINEVENLSYIFKKMEVDFKLLSSDIDNVEDNSKGLQVEFLNKQKLHSTLQSMLEKVSINSDDLNVIANFQDFDRWKVIPQLELNLLELYSALSTIRNDNHDSTEGLSSMNALRQYQRTFEEVTYQFITNFNNFIINQLKSLLHQLSDSLENFSTHFMLRELNNLLIYSGITYFVKYVDATSFRELNQKFNGEISNLLDSLLNVKLKRAQTSNISSNPSFNSRLSHSLESGSSLKKSRTLRLTRKDKLRAVEDVSHSEVGLERKPNEIEDPMVVNNFADEAKDLISAIQYFVVTFFHYDSNTLDFELYIEENPFEDRRKLIDTVPSLEIDELNIGKSYSTNDLINNMTMMFGNFINLFMKKVNPVDYRIPQVLIHIEDLLNKAQNQRANQEFLVFNFLKRAIDKYKSNWNKFIATNIESINKSLIVANSGILSSIRNINQVVLATERATSSRISQETDVPQMIDESYKQITEALIHLFMRDDPLLKNREFDDKERVHRNVSILQNLFYLIDLFKSINSPSTLRICSKLEPVFNKVRDVYFQRLINKSIGKLVEFINNYEALEEMNSGKTKKFNKKHVKSLLVGYTQKDITQKVHEMHKKLEKHFITGEDMFERDMLNKLWLDMEAAYNTYLQKLNVILRKEFGNEIEYSMSKQEIHSIFRSVH